MVDDLPTGYYRDNFAFMIDFVREHYDDVLSVHEKVFYQQFTSSGLHEQQLFVRLISRKGPCFRADKLQYKEIPDVAQVLEELEHRGFISRNHETAADVWLQLATKPELLSCFDVRLKTAKKELVCLEIAEAAPIDQIQQSLPFDLVEPLHQDTLAVYRLLFFGNLYQDLNDFVLRDLGITPFENYSLDPAGRYFDRREPVEEMLAAFQLQDEAYAVMASSDARLADFAATRLLQLGSDDPQLSRRHSKILNRVARQLEREAEPAIALSLYERSTLTPARERRTRLLASQGEPAAAFALCQEILTAPTTEEEYEFAVNFGHRLTKQHELSANDIPAKWQDCYSVDAMAIPFVPDQRVERTTADWLQRQSADDQAKTAVDNTVVWYVENGLLPGLFGLYFWDIIFLPVPGAFFNPFQRGPADLFEGEFYAQRRVAIESRFEKMSDSMFIQDRILSTFSEKFGIANHFVMWRMLSVELLNLALERMPVTHLESVFRRLLRDLKNNRSGFPDLVYFPPNGGYEMIEVKGPGDTLQANQRRWLRFFYEQNMPARVMNISWQK